MLVHVTETPNLTPLQPNKLVRIIHLSISIQTSVKTTIALVKAMLHPKWKNIVRQLRQIQITIPGNTRRSYRSSTGKHGKQLVKK
jgi:hypothetical protein